MIVGVYNVTKLEIDSKTSLSKTSSLLQLQVTNCSSCGKSVLFLPVELIDRKVNDQVNIWPNVHAIAKR